MNFVTFIALLALSPSVVDSSIYTISDDRIRSLDITPALGRGYSIMTNAFHSTCLIVDETTTPSFNYDYFFTDFTASTDREKALSGAVAGSFSYSGISGASSTAFKSTSKVSGRTRTIAATMRIERYYSSVKEEVSPLSSDALTLLTNEDYVGFFKACGPNYVRGIRRAQEVTATFQFITSSRENAKQFASAMRLSSWLSSAQGSVFSRSKYRSASSSLKITIVGYGLGLSQEGSETMVATSMDEYNNVMRFAFKTMTQMEDSDNVGMVYGMEVVPWVHNVAFQAGAELLDENILIPMPRSLIPQAYTKDKSDTTPFSNTETVRDLYQCKGTNFKMDKFGYCCEVEQLYDIVNGVYRTVDNANAIADVCRPIRNLDRSVVKDNMSNNGEFVARLSAALRHKLVSLSVLEKCISASNAIPDKFLDHVIKPQDSVKYPGVITAQVSLRHLKLAVDPAGDYTLVRHMGKELDEWIEMYYSPCMAAIFGSNIGTTPEVEAKYFSAYPWYHHDECMHLTCLTPNFRWDRKGGGCVPGLINGADGATYDTTTGSDDNCAKDEDENDADEEVCKYDQQQLKTSQDDFIGCWEKLPVSSVDYFINYYCMPQVTADQMPDDQQKTELITLYDDCRTSPSTSSGTPIRRLMAFEAESFNPLSTQQKDEKDTFKEDLRLRMGRLMRNNREEKFLSGESPENRIENGKDVTKKAGVKNTQNDEDFVANLKMRIERSRMKQ